MNMFSGGSGMFGGGGQRGYQMTPEEEEDLLSSLGRAGLSTLAYIGESIDKPMAALRGLLAGRPEELSNIIPFSDALGITSSDGMFGGTALQVTDDEDTVYGRDLLETWGIADENNDGLGGSDWGNIDYGDAGADLAGFAIDLLGVPMAGPVNALTKAGKLAKMAGISSDAAKLAKLGGQGATKFRVTNTLDDAIDLISASRKVSDDFVPTPRVDPSLQPGTIDALNKFSQIEAGTLGRKATMRVADEPLFNDIYLRRQNWSRHGSQVPDATVVAAVDAADEGRGAFRALHDQLVGQKKPIVVENVVGEGFPAKLQGMGYREIPADNLLAQSSFEPGYGSSFVYDVGTKAPARRIPTATTREELMSKLYRAGEQKGMDQAAVDAVMGQQLGHTMRFGGLTLPKKVDYAVASGIDKLGRNLGRTNVGRMANQAFAPEVSGLNPVVGQERIGPLHRMRQLEGEELARAEMAKFGATVHRHADTLTRLGDGDMVSGVQRAVELKDLDKLKNWPGLVEGDFEKILEVKNVRNYTGDFKRRVEAAGAEFAELDDDFAYHLARGELGRQQNILEGQSKQFNAVDASTVQGRQEFLKNFPGGTPDLREIAIQTAHDGPEAIAEMAASRLQPVVDDLRSQLLGTTNKRAAATAERAAMAKLERAALREVDRPARDLARLERQRDKLAAKLMELDYTDPLSQPMTAAQRAQRASQTPPLTPVTGSDYFTEKAYKEALELAAEGGAKTRLIGLTPDEFLKMAEELPVPDADKLKNLEEVLSRGDKLSSLPRLSFARKGGIAEVVGHEGRHRALKLKELGVEEMPVYLQGDIRFNEQADLAASNLDRIKGIWPEKLIGETSGEIQFPVRDPSLPELPSGTRVAPPQTPSLAQQLEKVMPTQADMAAKQSTKLNKINKGEYEYRGYKIARPEKEDGTLDLKAWDILQDTPGGPVAQDRLGSLSGSKEMIDYWVDGSLPKPKLLTKTQIIEKVEEGLFSGRDMERIVDAVEFSEDATPAQLEEYLRVKGQVDKYKKMPAKELKDWAAGEMGWEYADVIKPKSPKQIPAAGPVSPPQTTIPAAEFPDAPLPDPQDLVNQLKKMQDKGWQLQRKIDQAKVTDDVGWTATDAAAGASDQQLELTDLIGALKEEERALKGKIKSVESKPEALGQYFSGLTPEVRLEGVFSDPVGMAKRNAEKSEAVIANAETTTDVLADFLSGDLGTMGTAELSQMASPGIMSRLKKALGFKAPEEEVASVTVGNVLNNLGFATGKRAAWGTEEVADTAADIIRRKMEPTALRRLDDEVGTLVDDLVGPRTESGIEKFKADQLDSQRDAILKATLPEPIVDSLLQLKRQLSGPDPTTLLKDNLIQFNRLWKGLQTNPWINFHIRNLGSGEGREVLAGNNPFKHFGMVKRLQSGGVVTAEEAMAFPGVREMMKAQNIPESDAADALRQYIYKYMPTEGQGMSLEDMGHRFSGLGDSAGTGADLGFVGGLSGEKPVGFRAAFEELKTPFSKQGRAANPEWKKPAALRGISGRDTTKFVPSAAGEKLGEGVEALNRIPSFLDQIEKGIDPRQAARNVNASQIDYSTRAFTPFENDIRRLGLMPFYSFSSRNIPYVAKELLNNPSGRTGTLFRGLTRLRSDDEFLPEHIAQSLAIPLGSTEEGEPRYLTGLGLMEEDVLGAIDTSNPLNAIGYEVMGRLSPLIKAPVEAVLGKSLFQSGYQGPRDTEDMDPQLGRLMSNIKGLVTGTDQRVAVDTRAYEPWMQVIPGIRAVSNLRQITDKRKWNNFLLPLLANQLTGSRVADVSASAQDASLMDMIANEYKDMGGRDFSNYYIPDAVQEGMTQEELNHLLLLRSLQSIRDKRKRERQKQAGY